MNLLLAAVAGVLHFLGFIGFGLWPLALITFVPLWLALERTQRPTTLGFVFGVVSYAGGFPWMWHIVEVFLGGNLVFGAAIWLLDASWFGLRYALYAMLYHLVRSRGWAPALAGVPTLVLIEWLFPMLFPVYFGHALGEQLVLIQIADLGGPLLLTGLLGLINAAAFEACRRQPIGRRAAATWAVAALALLASWSYGGGRFAARDGDVAVAPVLRVGIVQGNLGVQEKGDDARHDHRRYLEQSRALLAAGDLDLLVWPETVYARGLRGPLPVRGDLIRDDLAVPLLFGGVLVRGDSGRRQSFNAALLIESDGAIRSAYEKNLLIPFTEYVPFADLLPDQWADRLASTSHFDAADTTPALALGAWRIATPICYEAVRPAFVRRMVRDGDANLIVTLANDAWFGDSQEPALHLAMARMRAIELRRYLVRATNTGISAVVDPTGRLIARSGLLTAENLRATVRQRNEVTVYARYGDWPGWLSAVVLAVAMVGRDGRQRRQLALRGTA